MFANEVLEKFLEPPHEVLQGRKICSNIFIRNGIAYATNGHSVVRLLSGLIDVPRKNVVPDGDPEFKGAYDMVARDFPMMVFGVDHSAEVIKWLSEKEACPECDSTGKMYICPNCNGSGEGRSELRNNYDCPDCETSGRVSKRECGIFFGSHLKEEQCSWCNGDGTVIKKHQIELSGVCFNSSVLCVLEGVDALYCSVQERAVHYPYGRMNFKFIKGDCYFDGFALSYRKSPS